MTRDVIIVVVFTCLLWVPLILKITTDIIKEYKCRKQFKELKIGDRYATLLTEKDDVFIEPVYAYVEITDKKEKYGIYYVQYKFIGSNTKDSMRFDRFLEIYFKHY